MLYYLSLLIMLLAFSLIVFKIKVISGFYLKYIGVISILLVAICATIFSFSIRNSNPINYCESLAHFHWSDTWLLLYVLLAMMSAVILQAYPRFFSILYFILVLVPLTLGVWSIKAQCNGNLANNSLLDGVQSLILFVSFPPIAIILFCLLIAFLFYFGKQHIKLFIMNSFALICVFLLLQQHALRDWIRFLMY